MPAVRPILSILVASDLSEESTEVIRGAADLALAAGAKLHVVHVHEEPSRIYGERELLTSQRQVHEKRVALLNSVKHAVPGGCRVGVTRVLVGTAADVILAEAVTQAASVIVIGPHKNRGVADRLLGSTAERLARHAAVPCLILNGPLQLPIRNILVPSDFSEPAAGALVTALWWAETVCEQGAGQITLAHVLDSAIEVDRAPWTRQEIADDLTSAATSASHFTNSNVPVYVRVLRGGPVEEVLEQAHLPETGLMVLGTNSDRVVFRALLGSVSSAMLRHARVPVLLVPRADGAKLAVARSGWESRRERRAAVG